MSEKVIVIAHFVSTLSQGSGSMAVLMNYFRHIDKKQVRFDFLYFRETPEETSYHDEIRRLGGKCVCIGEPSLVPANIKRVEKFFRQSEYSILHVHEVYLTFWIAPIAKRAGISAVIAHSHMTQFGDVPWKAVRNRMLCLPASYLSDYKCACSNAAAKAYFGNSVIQSNRYFLVHNAVNPMLYRFSGEDRKRYREEFGLADNDMVLGHIGRLVPQKNQEFLLEVFSILHEYDSKLKLLIIGDGYLRDRLKEICRSLKLDNFTIWGGVRTDAPRIYNAFDAFFLPSLFEGLPNVLIEAQCNGLPCFMSTAITREAVILGTCRSVDIRKGAAYCAEQIKPYLHGLSRDENAVLEIAKAGYDISVESGRLLEFYKRVLRETAHEN